MRAARGSAGSTGALGGIPGPDFACLPSGTADGASPAFSPLRTERGRGLSVAVHRLEFVASIARSTAPARMTIRILLVLLALAALAPAQVRAQATTEDSVRAVVVRLFDGMRTRDSAAVRAAFAPGARLQTALVRRDGTPQLTAEPVDSFVHAVGAPSEVVWDERVDAVEVRIDGPLAVVTVDYSFYAGPRFSHCGIDAFQLFRGPEGWKIFQLTDTRRRTGCRAENGSSSP